MQKRNEEGGGDAGKSYLLLQQNMVVEENDCHSPHTDGRVGYIEDGPEEGATADDGERLWPFPQGEIEHIHHSSAEESPIALPHRHQFSRGSEEGIGGLALGEYQSVETIVDDVADGSRNDEREADDVAHRQAAPDAAHEIPREDAHGQEAEQRQDAGADEVHAKGHTPIFYEGYMEPRCQLYMLIERHVGLYPYLGHLVGHED